MSDKKTIKLKGSDEEVSTYAVAKGMTAENMAEVLENFCGSFLIDRDEGIVIGKLLRNAHHTLHRSVIVFLLGIIEGLSMQEYTDARNETAVSVAKMIHAKVESGEYSCGMMI